MAIAETRTQSIIGIGYTFKAIDIADIDAASDGVLRLILGVGPDTLEKIYAFVEWERRFLADDEQDKYEGSLGDDLGPE